MSQCNPISLNNFCPPAIHYLKGEKLHNQFTFGQKHLGIPIRIGRRVYILLRKGEDQQVQAIDENRNHLLFSNQLKSSLLRAFFEYKNIVIEGFIDKNHLSITDLVSINGKYCNMNLTQRLAIVRGVDLESTYVSVSEPLEIDVTFLEEAVGIRECNVRYYIIKDRHEGFQQAHPYFNNCFLLPNFYTLKMSVTKTPSYASRQYEVAVIRDNTILVTGTIESNRPMSMSENVVVNFSAIKNGKLEDAWLADLTHYRNEPFEKSLNGLPTDLSPCWAARLTSTYESRCSFNSNPNGIW